MAGSEPAQKVRLAESEAERRLIEAAQVNRARFGDVYEHYFEMVYAYVARRAAGRAETEDLTAEVFRRALASLPRFKWTGAPFGSWLLRIASNLIADRAKKMARETSLDDPDGAVASQAARTPQTKQSQQSELEESERRAHLFRLVADLAEDQHRVVVMRFAEEKSISEIATALGRSEGAIKQLQFRALQNLRERIASQK